MASEVNRQTISVEDFSSFFRCDRSLLTRAFGAAPLFSLRVAAAGLHQTANQGQRRPAFRLDLPAAGTFACALEIMRSPRRLFKATRSRSEERSPFSASSTRGQPRGKVVMVRFKLNQAEPRRGPIKATRSGMVAHECVAGSSSQCCRTRWWRSSLACLRSAVWLPGTVGQARLRCRHRGVSGGDRFARGSHRRRSVVRDPARAHLGADAGTSRAPPRATAVGAASPTGPARCRRHRSGNSDTGSYPSGPRTRAGGRAGTVQGHGPRHCGPWRDCGW